MGLLPISNGQNFHNQRAAALQDVPCGDCRPDSAEGDSANGAATMPAAYGSSSETNRLPFAPLFLPSVVFMRYSFV
jgi:hypothetical protein